MKYPVGTEFHFLGIGSNNKPDHPMYGYVHEYDEQREMYYVSWCTGTGGKPKGVTTYQYNEKSVEHVLDNIRHSSYGPNPITIKYGFHFDKDLFEI